MVLGGVSFTQELQHMHRTIKWNCLEVDKGNILKAIRSIKHNGVKDVHITKNEDYLGLIYDYTDIIETENGINYLMLQFDEVDESKYHLILRIDGEDIKQIQYKLYENVIA